MLPLLYSCKWSEYDDILKSSCLCIWYIYGI